ncbi:hypothetical protein HYH03_004249 [Edaphochlamys debaryana]|uniref:Protein kinase domain-containing protein n=1 Tax=Edaphochlamys debaryana TaxID=47281 RepID=A0A835YFW5_9CHLO|nr:hypothetical protein HYH03_004249 [Edaphochlamys debaryana]|eukprot:KAG2497990.1 hypothetical protein HYH03_004249 [Edaphochlamys debaryana]
MGKTVTGLVGTPVDGSIAFDTRASLAASNGGGRSPRTTSIPAANLQSADVHRGCDSSAPPSTCTACTATMHGPPESGNIGTFLEETDRHLGSTASNSWRQATTQSTFCRSGGGGGGTLGTYGGSTAPLASSPCFASSKPCGAGGGGNSGAGGGSLGTVAGGVSSGPGSSATIISGQSALSKLRGLAPPPPSSRCFNDLGMAPYDPLQAAATELADMSSPRPVTPLDPSSTSLRPATWCGPGVSIPLEGATAGHSVQRPVTGSAPPARRLNALGAALAVSLGMRPVAAASQSQITTTPVDPAPPPRSLRGPPPLSRSGSSEPTRSGCHAMPAGTATATGFSPTASALPSTTSVCYSHADGSSLALVPLRSGPLAFCTAAEVVETAALPCTAGSSLALPTVGSGIAPVAAAAAVGTDPGAAADLTLLRASSLTELSTQLEWLRWMASGSSGRVYTALWKGSPVAVKLVISATPDQLRENAREALLSRVTSHPALVQCYTVCTEMIQPEHLRLPAPSGAGGGGLHPHNSSVVLQYMDRSSLSSCNTNATSAYGSSMLPGSGNGGRRNASGAGFCRILANYTLAGGPGGGVGAAGASAGAGPDPGPGVCALAAPLASLSLPTGDTSASEAGSEPEASTSGRVRGRRAVRSRGGEGHNGQAGPTGARLAAAARAELFGARAAAQVSTAGAGEAAELQAGGAARGTQDAGEVEGVPAAARGDVGSGLDEELSLVVAGGQPPEASGMRIISLTNLDSSHEPTGCSQPHTPAHATAADPTSRASAQRSGPGRTESNGCGLEGPCSADTGTGTGTGSGGNESEPRPLLRGLTLGHCHSSGSPKSRSGSPGRLAEADASPSSASVGPRSLAAPTAAAVQQRPHGAQFHQHPETPSPSHLLSSPRHHHRRRGAEARSHRRSLQDLDPVELHPVVPEETEYPNAEGAETPQLTSAAAHTFHPLLATPSDCLDASAHSAEPTDTLVPLYRPRPAALMRAGSPLAGGGPGAADASAAASHGSGTSGANTAPPGSSAGGRAGATGGSPTAGAGCFSPGAGNTGTGSNAAASPSAVHLRTHGSGGFWAPGAGPLGSLDTQSGLGGAGGLHGACPVSLGLSREVGRSPAAIAAAANADLNTTLSLSELLRTNAHGEDEAGLAAQSLPAVLQGMGAVAGRYATVVVLELCNQGTLLQALRSRPFNPERSVENRAGLLALLRTALEVAQGMAYLHSLGIIHGDLKPSNVLLQSRSGASNSEGIWAADLRGFVAKVADFGLAHPAHNSSVGFLAGTSTAGGDLTHPWGALAYLAPEVPEQGPSKKSDVWAYGCLLYHMCTGKQPFQGIRQGALLVGLATGQLRLEWPQHVYKLLSRLGEACCSPDPRDRPSFDKVVQALQKIIRHVASSNNDGSSRAASRAGHKQEDAHASLTGEPGNGGLGLALAGRGSSGTPTATLGRSKAESAAAEAEAWRQAMLGCALIPAPVK